MLWLNEFSVVVVSCLTLSRQTIWTEVSSVQPEDSPIPLFEASFYWKSRARRLVNNCCASLGESSRRCLQLFVWPSGRGTVHVFRTYLGSDRSSEQFRDEASKWPRLAMFVGSSVEVMSCRPCRWLGEGPWRNRYEPRKSHYSEWAAAAESVRPLKNNHSHLLDWIHYSERSRHHLNVGVARTVT